MTEEAFVWAEGEPEWLPLRVVHKLLNAIVFASAFLILPCRSAHPKPSSSAVQLSSCYSLHNSHGAQAAYATGKWRCYLDGYQCSSVSVPRIQGHLPACLSLAGNMLSVLIPVRLSAAR